MKFAVVFLLTFSNFVRPDPAGDQLNNWRKVHAKKAAATNEKGVPVPSLTAGRAFHPYNRRFGAYLLLDTFFIDHLAQFDRQRIPERVVHAKGAGAYGYFEVTHDISRFTKAKFLSAVGKRTPCFARFSTVDGESGSADTAQSPKGFAVKFYTEDGNFDFVGLNFPIFSIRDAMLFPSLIASRKRNPQTHLPDANSLWDFISLRPETIFQSLLLFGPDAYSDGYRFMHGAAVHTFKMINGNNQPVFVKLHLISNQGLKYLTPQEAQKLAGSDEDYATRDLYNAIAEKNYPSWTFSIQVLTVEQAENYRWNAFDSTKLWREEDVPLIPVGRLVLNRNVADYFSETEQSAFDPGNLVPGFEMSPDPLFHGRTFSYLDTQRYRLGTNFNKLPINHPLDKISSYARDGNMCFENGEGAPNFFPNSFHGAAPISWANQTVFPVSAGTVSRRDSRDDDNFSQAAWYWTKAITEETRLFTIKNLAKSLSKIYPFIMKRVVENYGQVNQDLKHALIAEISRIKSAKNVVY